MSSQRRCPCCDKVYGPDYHDTFCVCGVELDFADAGGIIATTVVEPAGRLAGLDRPAPGTPCLVLYGPDRTPLRYFPLTRDVTAIGRQDPVAGHFPAIDLSTCLDAASARKVSRAHALVLHSRLNDSYLLRPMDGNTGTQLETEMVQPQQDYPLRPGSRLILGGAVRFKFEIA
jgi:hypothetical protein